MKNLKFHIGRGGRFNNQGYVRFREFENITDGHTFDNLFSNDDWSIVQDAVGNELNFEINEDGTGYVEEDGEYDTTIVVKEDNLNEKQIFALIRDKDDHWNKEEIQRILNEYYSEYLED